MMSLVRGFWSYWSTKSLLNYRVSAKVGRNVFPNLLKKRNLTAIPLSLIPEYGQSNATLMANSKERQCSVYATNFSSLVPVIGPEQIYLKQFGQYQY